jgi:hypothetical protein
MREFFDIQAQKYVFEWNDVSALLTVLNVVFIIAGCWWAPILGLMNALFTILLNCRHKAHLNLYIIQIALIILNVYFLK